jgi:hypothetical protein
MKTTKYSGIKTVLISFLIILVILSGILLSLKTVSGIIGAFVMFCLGLMILLNYKTVRYVEVYIG